MSVTDNDLERVVRLLIQDLHATIGPGYDILVESSAFNARHLLVWTSTPDAFTEHAVEDVQQMIHDQFIDTAWPKCPRQSHPLWFRDGAWSCGRHHVRVALGELTSIIVT